MYINILIGGKAGQGINKVSEIVSNILIKMGYFVFNYRDYPSLIRGGHNFNILAISDERIGSFDSMFDGIVALDDNTLKIHKKELKENGFIIKPEKSNEIGINLNNAMAGALAKILGIDKKILFEEIKKEFDDAATKVAEEYYEKQEKKFNLEKRNNEICIMSGSQAVAQGAIDSKIDLYMAYPMTPASTVMYELASKQTENNLMVFQPEEEIAVVNAAIGASFVGAKVLIGTSGGGFDLMTEALSFQGQSEIPLVIYFASRVGPGTGAPTYTSQSDLNAILMSGHGEFPRIVVAPGDPIEAIEKTNEAFYLAEKFRTLAIIYSDKHLAESFFSFDTKPKKAIEIERKRKIPPEDFVKASSYEHDEFGNTTESTSKIKNNALNRIKKSETIRGEIEKFEMFKIHGRRDSKNLVIGWGSTKGAILDSIKGLDVKFLQLVYLEPFSAQIKKEIENVEKVILVECNSTGQLGRLIKEKTGVEIKEKILKHDGLPFIRDELKKEIEKKIR